MHLCKPLIDMSRHSVLPVYSDDPNVTETDVAEKAWKYVGYKAFSRHIASSRSFFFIRQFRTLNVRIILAMQDQLVELEEELNLLDNQLSRKDAKDIHNGSFRQETDRNRLNLIWEIQRKLKDYSMGCRPLQVMESVVLTLPQMNTCKAIPRLVIDLKWPQEISRV